MNQSDPIDVLNRLLRIVYRSLPIYLAKTKPWALRGGEQADLVESIAADQSRLAGRIADAIARQGGSAKTGSFPLEFTAKHDLAMDYLLQEATEHLQRDIAAIELCVADLQCAPFLQPLAQEVLGNTRGHLDNLNEMMNDK